MAAVKLEFALVATACAMLAGGCSGPRPLTLNTTTSVPARPTGAGAELHWMIALNALKALQTASPTLAASDFSSTSTFVLQPPDQPPDATGIPMARFRSFAAFQAAIAGGGIDPGFHWVLYDNEHWPSTPLDEQQNPTKYMSAFVTLAHAHGYRVMLAPAQDLVSPFRKGTREWPAYLAMGLARAGGRADGYEIQAQPYEGSADYATFVATAAAQARAVSANVTILAGISTHRVTSGAQMYDDIIATRSSVAGYWLNIPDLGHRARKSPEVGYAVQALTMLG
jgi:hypothetical protein